jgi:hypothetical protein
MESVPVSDMVCIQFEAKPPDRPGRAQVQGIPDMVVIPELELVLVLAPVLPAEPEPAVEALALPEELAVVSDEVQGPALVPDEVQGPAVVLDVELEPAAVPDEVQEPAAVPDEVQGPAAAPDEVPALAVVQVLEQALAAVSVPGLEQALAAVSVQGLEQALAAVSVPELGPVIQLHILFLLQMDTSEIQNHCLH